MPLAPRVPLELLSDGNLTPAERLMMGLLLAYAQPSLGKMTVWPSNATLAAGLGLKRTKSAYDLLRSLSGKGYVVFRLSKKAFPGGEWITKREITICPPWPVVAHATGGGSLCRPYQGEQPCGLDGGEGRSADRGTVALPTVEGRQADRGGVATPTVDGRPADPKALQGSPTGKPTNEATPINDGDSQDLTDWGSMRSDWNGLASQCQGIKGMQKWLDHRKASLGARAQDLGVSTPEAWAWLLGKIRKSAFLRGDVGRVGQYANRQWSLDWFLKPTNFNKVREGLGDDRGGSIGHSADRAEGRFEVHGEDFSALGAKGRRAVEKYRLAMPRAALLAMAASYLEQQQRGEKDGRRGGDGGCGVAGAGQDEAGVPKATALLPGLR